MTAPGTTSVAQDGFSGSNTSKLFPPPTPLRTQTWRRPGTPAPALPPSAAVSNENTSP